MDVMSLANLNDFRLNLAQVVTGHVWEELKHGRKTISTNVIADSTATKAGNTHMMLNLVVETSAEPVSKKTVLNITASDNLNLEKLHLFSLFLADDRHTAVVKGEYKSKSVASGGLANNKEENSVKRRVDPEVGDGTKHSPVNNNG